MVHGVKLVCVTLMAMACGWANGSHAADAPGVTPTEIKIGGVFPFSGPASSIGLVGRGKLAYVQSINDSGGIGGRKINYLALDDAYSTPKPVEHVRRLVGGGMVLFSVGPLGIAA